MLEPIFGFLLQYNPIVAVTTYSIIVIVLINVFYKVLVKQGEAKDLKAKVKELNKRMKEEQKAGNKDASTKTMSEMMQQNAKLMKMTMLPMFVSLIIVVIFLPFLSSAFGDIHVAINNNAGNFTLNGNLYNVEKDGNSIMITGISSVTCEYSCIQKIDNNLYEIHEDGQNVILSRVVALLPMSLPFVGSTLGWLGWYILISFALVILIRKLMKIYV